jgi:hypothetical protein
MGYDEYRDLKMVLNAINTTLKLETIKTWWVLPNNHDDKSCKEFYRFQKSNNKSFMQNPILK